MMTIVTNPYSLPLRFHVHESFASQFVTYFNIFHNTVLLKTHEIATITAAFSKRPVS